MIHFRTDFCEKILQLVICQSFMCAKSFINWRKAQMLDFWKTPIHNLFFSFSISNLHGSPLSPRICTMSMRALLLYVQSTQARDITTDSMSEWGKWWNQFFDFFENSAKRRKSGKSQLFAVQTRIPQSSLKKKMARLERSNFQFKKSIRIEKFEYRRLLDKYQSCLPEYVAWKQIWVLSKINYNFFSQNIFSCFLRLFSILCLLVLCHLGIHPV